MTHGWIKAYALAKEPSSWSYLRRSQSPLSFLKRACFWVLMAAKTNSKTWSKFNQCSTICQTLQTAWANSSVHLTLIHFHLTPIPAALVAPPHQHHPNRELCACGLEELCCYHPIMALLVWYQQGTSPSLPAPYTQSFAHWGGTDPSFPKEKQQQPGGWGGRTGSSA